MDIIKNIIFLFIILTIPFQTGCSTYRTISEADTETVKIFSGTRLDIIAIQEDKLPTKQFKSKPPTYPLLDLPFSFAFDILLLPLTTTSALYYEIFE